MKPVVVGTTKRWMVTATKDGEDWDLSAATVELFFHRPDKTTSDAREADGDGGATNKRYYDNATSEFQSDNVGTWTVSVRITDGAVVEESDPIEFSVIDSP